MLIPLTLAKVIFIDYKIQYCKNDTEVIDFWKKKFYEKLGRLEPLCKRSKKYHPYSLYFSKLTSLGNFG